MSQDIIHLIEALWFGKQAVEDGFVAPEDCFEKLFSFLDTDSSGSFDTLLEESGLLTAFQRKKLVERLAPLPDSLLSLATQTRSVSSPLPQTSALDDRYQLGEIIQQGGVGRIYKAYDRVVGRDVAIKCLLDPKSEEARRRFENEYKITGGLDHPNIISVHDACHSEKLGPFYVMRLLEGKTLRQVLRAGHGHGLPGRTALLRIFLDICAAVAFAHSRGILHRDLKPSNIMVGELGEVQVMDWGIARLLIDQNLPTPSTRFPKGSPQVEMVGVLEAGMTHHGAILGTPGYMAPEQARGEHDVNVHADIFALGCILYEMLTGQLPFSGTLYREYLSSIDKGSPQHSSSIDPTISEELDEIVMLALEIDVNKRYPSVRDLSTALSIHLEGTRTQKIRKQRALSKVAEGIQACADMQQSERKAERILGEVRGAEAKIRPYDPSDKKRPIWEKVKQVEQLEKDGMVQLGEAISALTQALALNPESQEAHGQLAALYFERLVGAERKKDGAQIAYHEAMLQRHNNGQYDLYLKNEGVVWLLSDPPGVQVTIHQLEEKDLIMVPKEGIDLGLSPVGPLTLPAGSYLAILHKDGFVDTRLPVLVQRDKRDVFRARMYQIQDLPKGYTYVPQGRFMMGGDPLTASAGQLKRAFVQDLFLSTFPVTMQDYLRFLNECCPDDPESMQKHGPRRSPDGGFYLEINADRQWVLPQIDEDGDSWDPMFPVLAISWYDADAYANWKAKECGSAYRLPLAEESEKAARGVDGRYFPWGDRFDATFCKIGKSRPGPPKPEPVGAYPLDVSVYGIHDLAGGVREWCGDVMEANDHAVAVGGHWSGTELTSRAAHRWNLQKGQIAPGIGMRLCIEASAQTYHKGFPEIEDVASEPVYIPSNKPDLSPSLFSVVRERLAAPQLWSALAENKDEWVLTQFVLAAVSGGASWAVIQIFDEDVPLASAGDAPDSISRGILQPFQSGKEDQALPHRDEIEQQIASSYTILPCGQPPAGCLVLPCEHSLSGMDLSLLCSAVSLVLGRHVEKQQASLREKQTMQEIDIAKRELTIVREAFATMAPETYLRDAYPLIDGRSRPIRLLFRMLDRLVESEVNVFIRGESGVGKERVAMTIHQRSSSKDGPFIAVNCGAIPENLVESELFGFVKGAFTGAEREQLGLFRQADGGTLFLDEVAELSLDAQVKLLRALQNKAVRPVGGIAEIPFQARILAATHRDLKQCVEEGSFRGDLYWRLVVMEVELPPLRERPEDIPILLKSFLDDWKQDTEISETAIELLQLYQWPGNIRELENELRRALVVADQTIKVEHLSRKLRESASSKLNPRIQGTLRELVAQVERDAIQLVLEQAGGNKSKTARTLGLSKRGLQLKMQRYGFS